MSDNLENEISRVLALKESKPVRRVDTLQSLCDILRGDCSPYGGPIDGELAGIGIVYRN